MRRWKESSAGVNGFCEVCGKPIAARRLEAIPWTTVCSEHARTE